MWNRRVVCVAWLLCVSLTAAFLDHVPDPPAIKQFSDRSQTFDFSEQLQTAAAGSQQIRLDRPDSSALAWWALEGHAEAPAVVESPLLRQAADPSPPFSVL